MRRDRFSRAPRSFQSASVHVDTVALFPASLLMLKAHLQEIVNTLPYGGILIILPQPEKQRRVAQAVALQLRERGKRIRVMDDMMEKSTFLGAVDCQL